MVKKTKQCFASYLLTISGSTGHHPPTVISMAFDVLYLDEPIRCAAYPVCTVVLLSQGIWALLPHSLPPALHWHPSVAWLPRLLVSAYTTPMER